MNPIAGTGILTAAAMRAAEGRAIAAGATVDGLMHTAGHAVAAAVRRLAGTEEILVACGPGNNGGDGYVAAAALRAAGLAVRVAASGDPRSDAATAARAQWTGPVEPLPTADPAPILVDAVFGTGLARPLEATLATALGRLVEAARLTIAVDLPSGVATDTGAVLGDAVTADVTLALGAVKPSHLLIPAAARCGAVRILDIGLPDPGEPVLRVAATPTFLRSPSTSAHKYTRGMVVVIAGTMPGAAELSAEAALRAGSGYVLLLGETGTTVPHAIVRRRFNASALDDKRIGAIVIGPGLGRDDAAAALLDAALAADAPLIVDGDALHLLDQTRLGRVRGRSCADDLHAARGRVRHRVRRQPASADRTRAGCGKPRQCDRGLQGSEHDHRSAGRNRDRNAARRFVAVDRRDGRRADRRDRGDGGRTRDAGCAAAGAGRGGGMAAFRCRASGGGRVPRG